MPAQKYIQDPSKNEYQVGIAHRLKVDPHRVNCAVRVGPKGGFLVDIQVDGRDLNGTEQRLVAEYLEEAFHGIAPKTVDG
jgi:hypothetical protein